MQSHAWQLNLQFNSGGMSEFNSQIYGQFSQSKHQICTPISFPYNLSLYI